MKKTITGIAALFMSIVMLASCGGTSNQPAQSNHEAEVRQTVTSFMEAYTDMDESKAVKYVTDEDLVDLPDMLAAMEDGMGEFEDMMPDIDKEAIVDKFRTIVKANINYDIDKVKVDGDKATAELTVTVPDASDMDSLFTEENLMEIMEDSFGFDINDPMAILNEYADKKGMDITELYALAAGDQDEFMKDFYNTFSGEFNDFIDGMIDMMADALDNAETEKQAVTMELELTDGDWLISDIDGLE